MEKTLWDYLNSTIEGKEVIEKCGITKDELDEMSKKFENMTTKEWKEYQINNPIGKIDFIKTKK